MSVLPFRQPAANPGRFEAAIEELERDLAPADVPAAIGRLAALQARLLLGELARTRRGAEDHLLTVGEAAARWGISKDWLYRHGRRLPFMVPIGRSVRFSESGMEEWAKAKAARKRA